MRTAISIASVLVVLGVRLGAQTLAEQLQQGIYTEEVLENRDEAVRIYRQILAAPSVPEAISTEARRRLAVLLLQSPPPVVLATTVVPSPSGGRFVLEGGRYRHVESGITFQVPMGWKIGPTSPSSDDGDLVFLTNDRWFINVWKGWCGHSRAAAWTARSDRPRSLAASDPSGGGATAHWSASVVHQ